MAKKYENKAVNGELVMVNFDTDIQKRNGGTYKGTEVIFKAYGKVNEKGIPEKTFEFKPDLRSQLEALNPKDEFTMNLYREEGTQFWNVDSFTKGHTNQAPSSAGTGQARTQQGSNFSGVNPAEVGQCLNLAVQLGLAMNYDELSDPTTMAIAISLYKGVKQQYTDNWDKSEVTRIKAEAPENTGSAKDEPFNDDVPF